MLEGNSEFHYLIKIYSVFQLEVRILFMGVLRNLSREWLSIENHRNNRLYSSRGLSPYSPPPLRTPQTFLLQ